MRTSAMYTKGAIAVEIVKEELRNTDGYKELDGGKLQLKFLANIVIATK